MAETARGTTETLRFAKTLARAAAESWRHEWALLARAGAVANAAAMKTVGINAGCRAQAHRQCWGLRVARNPRT